MTTPQDSGYRGIPLTKGQFTLVSAHRYEELRKFKWCASWSSSSRSYYAVRMARTQDGKKFLLSMHRQILGLTYGDPRIGDHIDANRTLDNRDENLRIATKAQNHQNSRVRIDTTSGFKGVQHHPSGAWTAAIRVNGKRYYLGIFKRPEDAATVYWEAAKKFHGEFARAY